MSDEAQSYADLLQDRIGRARRQRELLRAAADRLDDLTGRVMPFLARAGMIPAEAAWTDHPQYALIRDVTALLTRTEQSLSELEAAAARLVAGTYGVCLRCGRAIPVGRLEARPGARHCVPCSP